MRRPRLWTAVLTSLFVLVAAGAARGQSGVQYVYDDLGRLIAVIDPTGDTATYTYDAVGNILAINRYSSSQVSIIGFTPESGPVGTVVTIAGTGFSATPSQDTVTFNGTAAAVTNASATQIVVTVPSGATTGVIGVTAPGGSATSAKAFTVTTGSLAPTITSFTPNAGPSGTAFGIDGTNFDPNPANDRAVLNATALTLTTATATHVDTSVPMNVTSGRVSLSTVFGTATSAADFWVAPPGYTAANLEVKTRIAGFGDANTVTATITNSSNIGLLIFDAPAGHRVSVKMANETLSSTVSLLSPYGISLATTTTPSTAFVEPVQLLPSSAFTYTLFVKPTGTSTGHVDFTVYDVPPDITGTIVAGGSPVNITATTPGQNAKLTFDGTAGQRISLLLSSVTIPNSQISILNPDGSALLAIPAVITTSGGFIDTLTLGSTGTYTILIDPTSFNTGNMTLTLYDVPPDVTGTITPGGSPVTVTTTTPGQNATLTFSGTASQRVSLQMTNVTITNSTVSILNPDGSTLLQTTVTTTGAFIDTQTLGSTGTYSIYINPANTYTGSMTLTLYNVPADVTGTIVPGGSPVTVTTTTPGQNASLTFSGTASQRVSLKLSSVTIAASNVSILNPDGSTLVAPTFVGTAGAFIDTQTLGTTGTYTIIVNPTTTDTGSMTLTLYNVPPDVAGTIVAGGSPVTVTTTTPGQNAGLTFGGTAAQRVSLKLSSVTIAASYVSILNPDGSTLVPRTFIGTAGGFIDTQTLGTTGTYTIVVDPTSFNTGNMTLTLYNVPADVTASVTVNGTAATVTTTTPGQNAQVTFAGTSGQLITVHITNNTMGFTTVKLLKPDGSQLTSTSSSASNFNLAQQTLPTTGTYTVVIDPSGANVGSMTVGVTNP